MCPSGAYSPGTHSTACQTCIPGYYGTALGASTQEACKSCAAGSYANGIDPASCVHATQFTWLYKDLSNGYYYVTLPTISIAASNYNNNIEYTYWSKVRIDSTLSQSMTQVQLYVQYLGSSEVSCLSNTMDTTYAKIPPSRILDFGSVGDCGFSSSSTRVSLEGTPFSILDQTAAWVAIPGPCNFEPALSVTCASLQDCTAEINANCGQASFNGILGVCNVSQFVADIQLACALYKNDPLLLCTGNETKCDDPCTVCPVGTYSSSSGASSCELCSAGFFSNATGFFQSFFVSYLIHEN